MVVNLKTAKTLDITIPRSILLRADEVIGQAAFERPAKAANVRFFKTSQAALGRWRSIATTLNLIGQCP